MLNHLDDSEIWQEWHIERHRARITASSLDEFSDIEIEKYDLDTADITGEDKPSTFITRGSTDPSVPGAENPTDIREKNNR